ncbi:Reverse transcriptase (RNA-dependent DNA polymerase) [Fragilaria crotonensis]|nr:Reverse transcriptase (RNA-dependent DNA polymerase) [Fragilaria crotonensis]
MEKKSGAGLALRQFIRDYGVPELLTSDGASEQTGPKTEFMKQVRKHGIMHHTSEPHRPQENRAESVIREVKKRWFRQMTKRRVPARLWDYGIVWVCEIMSLTANSVFSLEGRAPIEQITGETPDIYLGAELCEKILNGVECWTMSSEKYVKAAVAAVEAHLDKLGQRLPTRCTTVMKADYRPELDTTAELNAAGTRYFQELVGILRWAIELGRIDIAMETSMLSSHLALPRDGHLQAVYHIFGYLKGKPKRTLAFDPSHPDIDETRFKECDWRDFYRDAKECIPGDAPEPRGNFMSTHCFVDADHAGNRITRRSQTGILIFCNRAPILWYSKRQNTVETSTFGSEFVAMRIAVELIEGLRYKLRMFGIPIDSPTNVFCDNEAVTKNVTLPESTLKKKHNAIAYHRSREAVAAGTIRVAKEDGKTNLADVLTKPLAQVTKEFLCDRFMY